MMLRNALQDMIDEALLEEDATRKGITVAQLVETASHSSDIARLANLPAPVKRLSLNAAQPSSTRDGSPDLKDQTRIRKALTGIYFDAQATIHITLPDPAPPILAVSSDNDPSIRTSDAPITIIEFSDFQCSYCKLSVPVIKEVLRQYPGSVKVIYRDYPGPNHPYALQAAEAAQCAGDQGKFWEYHDLLFSRQVSGIGWDFPALADELKLDTEELMSCLNKGRYRHEVLEDLHDGRKLGVSSTPTFFVNGRPLIGARPFADFKAMIDPLLQH